MKAARFHYERASSVDQAVHLLEDAGSSAKVLAGGQSLVPLMAFRLVRPELLIDITGIQELKQVRVEPDFLTIGAVATHRSVELHPEVCARVPLISAALRELGHVAIRNIGTIGGSLAHADPAAEWPAVALALGGTVKLVGPEDVRILPVDRLFVDWMQADLRRGEMVAELCLPVPPCTAGWGFAEVARRRGDFALAGAAVVLEAGGGEIRSARIGIMGAGLTPVRALTVEAALIGRPPKVRDVAQVIPHLNADIRPLEDQHASAEQRRVLAGVVLERALADAVARLRVLP